MFKLSGRTIWSAACIFLVIPLAGCPERAAPRPRPTDADRRQVVPSSAPRPVETSPPPAGGRAPIPASAPATKPATRVDGTPEDFRIILASGDDSHTGFWITILAKTAPGTSAEVRGRVADRRKVYIETTNVEAFRVDFAAAPVDPGRNLGIFLDGQPGIEIRRSTRALKFHRSRGGVWERTKSAKAGAVPAR